MKKKIKNRVYRMILPLLIGILSGISVVPAQTGKSVLQGEITTNSSDGNAENLPGAKTILTGTEKNVEPVELFADDTGNYRFTGLVAGSYILEIALEGFKTVRINVIIPENQIVIENIGLELDALTATVTVESGENVINTTDSTASVLIKAETLQEVPLLEEKFQEALPLVPGVVRGPDGMINVKGAASTQSGTLVGQANGDDPVTGNMAIDLPLEAVESVEIVSNPYSAEFGNFSGGVVHLQTRSGSNEWNYGFTNFFPRLRKRGGSIRGIESIKPRLNFSGPFIKDKLTFFQSFEYKFVQTRVESLPDLSSDTKFESFDSFTRIDYSFSDLHRLNATFALFPQKLDFANLNTFNPQETAANFHQRGWMLALNDNYVTAKGGILQTTFSVKKADADVFGNSTETFTIASQTNSGGFFNRQSRETLRYEGQSIYSFPAFEWSGQHSLKFGGGFGFTTFDGTNTSGDVQIARADGTLSRLQTYLGNGTLSRNKSEIGLFVQDKWIINPRLTIDLGVRFDADNLGETYNPAPRLGFVFSPFDDQKTVLRGGIGVFYSKIPLNVGVFEQNQDVLIRSFARDGATPLGETVFRNSLANGDIKTPYNISWNLRLDREISERLLVGIGYEQRATKRDFLLEPIVSGIGNEGIYELGSGGKSSYREFLLTARFRLQENRDLFFSYTRSRAVGDLNAFGGFAGNIANPIVRENEYSRLSFDTPNRFLFWGDIGLPLGITFIPLVDWRTGFPYSTIDENQNFTAPRNSGARFPQYFSADVQILKDFKINFKDKSYRLRAGVKFFNITNHFNPRDVQNNSDSPEFGGFYNGVGRRTRFKFEIGF